MKTTPAPIPVPIPKTRQNTAWLKIAFIVVLVTASVPALGWLFLRSSQPRRIASERLGDMLGVPVIVETLQFGSAETELKMNVPNPSAEEPLVRVESVRADVTLRSLMTGSAEPREVVLRGVEVVVPFDREGRVRWEVPATKASNADGPRPRLRIEDLRVRLRGEGRPEFVLDKASLTAEPNAEGYQLSGSARDPVWGEWTIRGTISLADRSGVLELATPDGPVDWETLRAIPAIPDETWEHARPTGRAAATVRLELDSQQSFRYAIAVMPKDAAQVVLPDLDIPLERVNGTVRVTGQTVTIEPSRATLAGGEIDVKGVLDFETTPSKMTFDVSARGLDVRRLPAEWGLPPEIEGRLRGRASLELTTGSDGRIQPRGGGVATLDDARLFGLPAEVRLRLRGDGRRYRFDSEKPAEPTPPLPFFLILAQPGVVRPPFAPPESTIDAAITLRDVDVTALLTQLNVDVPYRLAGKVTLRVSAAVPVGQVTSRGAYRFRGTLSSDRFRFEGLEATGLRADLDYRDGVLSLRELQATIPHTGGNAGTVSGTASAEIEPKRNLNANLTLTDVSLERLARALPGTSIPVGGRLTGHAEVRAKMDTLRDTESWAGSARIHVKAFTVGSRDEGELRATATLARGVLTLTDASATVFRGKLDGSAAIPLSESRPGNVNIRFHDLDAAEATRQVPNFPVPLTGRISGRVVGTASAASEGKPRTVEGTVDLSAKAMTVQGIPAERLTGSVAVVAGRAEYRLEGHSLGGTFDVKGQYPAKPEGDESLRVRLRNLNLARLADTLRVPHLAPLRGTVNATFDGAGSGMNGEGRVTIDALAWGNEPVGNRLAGAVVLRDGVLDLRDLSGDAWGGRLRGRVRYDIYDRRRNFYTVTIDRASTSRLSALFPSGVLGPNGDASVVSRGRFGAAARHSLSITLARATFAGLPVSDLTLPVEITGDLSRGHVTLRGARASVGNGRVAADLQFSYGLASRVHGTVTFDRVPLRTVIGSAASTFGNGTIRGRLDLSGEGVRSVDDLTGTLNAALNHTSVREVPLLNVTTPFLSPFGLVQPFEAGEIKGRLAKGIFRLERFVLSNPSAHIHADGTVTRQGRVDLDLIAVTGQIGPNVGAFRLIGLNIPALGSVPVSLAMRVSQLLSNRTVRLAVTGTLDAPQVRVNTAALLSDSIVRFVVGQYVLPEGLSGVVP